MSKFAGLVGYVTQEESAPGVWTQVDKTSKMKGDIIRQSSSSQNGDKINSDVALSHRVSLLGDSYAFNNYFAIKWIQIDGRKWQVTSVELQRPRIILTVGGLWNG
jgi:hypothetical protein